MSSARAARPAGPTEKDGSGSTSRATSRCGGTGRENRERSRPRTGARRRARKVSLAGRREVLRPGRHVRDVRRDEAGDQFPARETVERDFAAMAANGINSVRTYTVPPTWLLDLALRARPPHDDRHPVGAPRRLPREPREPRVDRRRVQEATYAPRRPPGRALPTRSATRSRPRSCAGTATAASSASSQQPLPGGQGARTPTRSSPT